MKITEIIYFGCELNLLEAHLATHRQLMDKIVVVECAKTPGGETKPLFFKDNYERFRKYDVEHYILPDEAYPNITTTNVEFIRQERPAKSLIHNLFVDDADWIFHSDTDEILDPRYFLEIRERLTSMPSDVGCIYYKLDVRSPFIDALSGTVHVHRVYRATRPMPIPKLVKRAPLVAKEDGICGWHFTNCYTTAEELYWKIKNRKWLIPEKSLEFCQMVMGQGLLRAASHDAALIQFVPNISTRVATNDLPLFMQENILLFLGETYASAI